MKRLTTRASLNTIIDILKQEKPYALEVKRLFSRRIIYIKFISFSFSNEAKFETYPSLKHIIVYVNDELLLNKMNLSKEINVSEALITILENEPLYGSYFLDNIIINSIFDGSAIIVSLKTK